MLNALTIRDGLVERGLPPHIAEGFVMNFEDESGLNPGINEAAPTVPGSRGGFGLAQWTGPRRVALEQFAASTGRDVSDPDAQLDFLMMELQGPEASAMRHIMQAGDAGDAGAAVARYFLRPAKSHLDRRVAEYQGGTYSLDGWTPEPGNALRGPDAPQVNQNALAAMMQQQPAPHLTPGVVDLQAALTLGQRARSSFA
jgi:hypothetical protein